MYVKGRSPGFVGTSEKGGYREYQAWSNARRCRSHFTLAYQEDQAGWLSGQPYGQPYYWQQQHVAHSTSRRAGFDPPAVSLTVAASLCNVITPLGIGIQQLPGFFGSSLRRGVNEGGAGDWLLYALCALRSFWIDCAPNPSDLLLQMLPSNGQSQYYQCSSHGTSDP